MTSDDNGGFVIFSGNKLWYASKEGLENTLCKTKSTRGVNKVRNSAKNKRVIEFQLFEDIKCKENDGYWFSFFEDAAVGKFPRNFKYCNGILSYRVKNKTSELKVPEGDLDEVTIVIKNFLFESAGIISPTDLQERRLQEELKISTMHNNEFVSWSQVRSEKQQLILISIFAEKIGEQFGLTLEERKALVQQVKLGILAGFFNSSTIEISGNQIVQIEGLQFNEESREFIIDTELCKITKPFKKNVQDTTAETSQETDETDAVNMKKSLLKNWNRYITEMNKKFK